MTLTRKEAAEGNCQVPPHKEDASRKLRKKILTEEQRGKLTNTIASCERSIRNFYQNKEETKEKEAWERMQENSRFFFHLAKKKSRLRASIGPFTNEKGELIEEKVCKTLNKRYFEVFDTPEEGDSLPEGYLDSEEDLPAETPKYLLQHREHQEGDQGDQIRSSRTIGNLSPAGKENM